MVIGTQRVMCVCIAVLLTNGLFVAQCLATDNRVKELAAKAGVRILKDSSSEKSLQKTAAAQVPLQRMSQRSQQRARYLLSNTSQYRRMPTLQYEVDASLYQYLINHPDVAIATWRVMGISKLDMWQTAPFEYEAKANDGSKGRADVLWRDANQCLFVVEGAYHSPLLPSAIEASALVWLRYRFERTRDDRVLVNQQIETFINFPSAAIETIAKLASMVTNSILDRNAMEVSLYAQMMSRAIDRDPVWVEEVADRMESVPERRKTELKRVAQGQNPYQRSAESLEAQRRVAVRSASPQMSQPSGQLSESKRQLLKSVRAGEGVIVVRKTPPRTSKSPVRPFTAEKAGRSDPVNESSSIPPLLPDRKMAATRKPMHSTVRIAAADTETAKASPIYSGYSKDGLPTAVGTFKIRTGPVKAATERELSEASESSAAKRSAVSQSEATQSEAKSRGGAFEVAVQESNQPALVALPPVGDAN